MTSTELTGPSRSRETVSIAIGGMTCGACAARIEQRLNHLDGVEASVNYASERAAVSAPPDVAPERLVDEIRAAGFTAHLVDDAAEELGDRREDVDRRVRSLGRRLVVAAVLFMPLCDASIAFWLFARLRFPHWQWVLVALAAPVLTYAAWPLYAAAVRAARHGTTTMDTLVSLGILSATGWSLYAMFWRDTGDVPRSILYVLEHQSSGAIYLDVAAGVTTFLLAGRYFEARCLRRSGDALRSLAAVGAKDVAALDADGGEHRVPVTDLLVGDRFVVRPGETVATDGLVELGHSSIDRSAMTGESLPVDVTPGDRVVGGTVSVGGRLVVSATRVGRDTQLAQMLRLVENAQNQKAAVQRLADRISRIFVPAVLLIALATFVTWLACGGSADQAFSAALAVMIIACPCALGLATPTALFVASGQGARLGIFFKGYQTLEMSRLVDTVVLDKTGTVTRGTMAVTDVLGTAGVDPDELLGWAGAVEQASEHLVARAVATAARAAVGALAPVDDFLSQAGLGARGTVDGHEVSVGKAALFADTPGTVPTALADHCTRWEALGRTTVLVGRDGTVVGAIGVADTLRPSAAPAVGALQALGLDCILVTGDNEPTARAVGASIGVSHVIADTLPADKVAVIRRLQDQGRCVAMIGDGVNDGPALAAADLGLAVGSGTDVAINAADLIIVRDDLRVAATAVALARRTLRTIRGNLVWAFGYNVAAIPLAACGLLNPLIAGAAMALSSGFVVWNSSRLRHVGAVEAPDEAPGEAWTTAAVVGTIGHPAGAMAATQSGRAAVVAP